MAEFDLIRRYFQSAQQPQHNCVQLGIGDDCALIAPKQPLAITTDTLICGTHFVESIAPYELAYRALATNLSDLAAMGATPKYFTLALSLNEADPAWLAQFSKGLFALANQFDCQLIGGDTTSGALMVSITAMGEVNPNLALKRSGARNGDLIYVSNVLGDAAGALPFVLNKKQQSNTDIQQYLLSRYHRPTPRVELGRHLLGLANSGLDISDGLLADLGHICRASQLDAVIDVDALPLSSQLVDEFGISQATQFALTGGDDYELCFTVSPVQKAQIAKISHQLNLPLTCVGQMQSGSGKVEARKNGKILSLEQAGFEHFS